MKSITCKASNDIVTSSTRDRNHPTIVMQINATEFNKSEINPSQSVNASQRLKKSIRDIVYTFMK